MRIRSFVFPVIALLAIAMLSGCGDNAHSAPSGLAEQQKGVMGGTPPPEERAKIAAMQADQARRTAAAQASAAARAQQGGAK